MSLQLKIKVLLLIALLEFLAFLLQGLSLTQLSGDPYFTFYPDPASYLSFLSGIPQFITGHTWVAALFELSVVALFFVFIRDRRLVWAARALFALLFLHYVIFMAYHGKANFQMGYWMVLFPFLFFRPLNRYFAFEFTRYYLLFYYASSAYIKLTSGSLFRADAFVHMLAGQFAPYFVEHNEGWRTGLNLFLLDHPALSQCLYILGFAAEAAALAGFFTKRFDRLLAAVLIVFHCLNWVLMDIAPFGQIAFICLLLLSQDVKTWRSKR